MRTLWIALAACVLFAAPARAQFLGPPQSITVVDSGTACVTAPAACATFDASTATSMAFDVSGTWTGTLTFEGTANGGVWRTLWVTNAATGVQQSTTTAGGTFTVANGGFTQIRARATASITGTAVVSGTRGYGVSAHLFDLTNVTGTLGPTHGGTGFASYAVGDLLTADTTTTLAKLADVAVGQVFVSGGVGVVPAYTANPAVSTVTANQPGIATTSTDGVIAANATAATAGVPVQQSPRIRLRSNVWNTTAVAANNTDDWWMESVPVSGTTPSGLLKFCSSLNGAAATCPATLSNTGTLKLATGVFNVPGSALSYGTIDLQNLQFYLNNAAIWFFDAASAGNLYPNNDNFFDIGATASHRPRTIYLGTSLVTPLTNTTATYQLNGVVAISATAPTIASGGCTSPAVTWANGTALFLLTLGSSCTGVKTITLTMPAAAHFWGVSCDNNTSDAAQALMYVVARATSTTAVVLTSYGRVAGVPLDYVAADTLLCKATGG